MSNRPAHAEASLSGTPSELSFMPDTLSEAMVATAAGYFLAGVIDAGEHQYFRQMFHNLYSIEPLGRVILGVGLLATGFNIELEPIVIDPPSIPPEEALDRRLLLENSYNVPMTLIDMGVDTMTPDNRLYSEEFDFVAYKIGRRT
jgi:hypothetical protein